MRSIAAIAMGMVLSAPVASAQDACGGSDAKYYDDGLIFHLTKAGVPYRRMYGGGLCVERKYAADLKASEQELERYFPQIAHDPKDACEERALAEWAEREKLRYELRPTVDAQHRPTGRKLFLIRSFTREEMVANREKLDRTAPVGATCKESK